ncbi:ATP-binding protein [Actinokineospora pegani]|uniref:ATP-binding protein n=1 Tax=Actinokineospora pegani TaxID=2654637 RepID=UPI0012EAA92B|nr:ATP-binding protein [Actinokineospora pegani]
MATTHHDDATHQGGAAPPTQLALSVPATPCTLSTVRADLDRWMNTLGVSTPTRQDVHLALGEALTNAIEHGHRDTAPAPVSLALSHGPSGITLLVSDQGTWKPPAPDPTRGRGLAMIETLSDRMTLSTDDGRTTLTARIPHR